MSDATYADTQKSHISYSSRLMMCDCENKTLSYALPLYSYMYVGDIVLYGHPACPAIPVTDAGL